MQPSIEIFGIKVMEPVTTVTDLMVAAVCFYGYVQLHKKREPEKDVIYFKYFFLLMAISTALGGIIGHGFLYAFGFGWKLPGWVIGMCSVAFIERAAIKHARSVMNPKVNTFFAYMNIVELAGFIVIAFYTLDFFYVEMHAAYGLIVVFLFECFVYQRKKNTASAYILCAVGVSALAALVHMAKISPHTWFNHNDLSHIFMALGSYLFYLGARRNKRRVKPVKE